MAERRIKVAYEGRAFGCRSQNKYLPLGLEHKSKEMSDFIVSARKYRPSTFDQVVGQEHVSKTLKNALRTDHLAHAFLFCGPRGVGKTTCARILAKVINCTNKTEDYEPCGKCDSCVAFQQNASFNISELDAASNNSVENIRSLVEQVRIPPQAGKYKVFIIDEVHMLSQSAFNAFLKTLEEPPPYAIFILATTEKHKILPTILSRCQIYDFKRIGVRDIVAHLDKICQIESLEAEPMALHVIGEKADGALRDALSIFDRLVSGSNGVLTYQSVINQLNILDYDIYMSITDALLLENSALVLNLLDDVVRKGFEPDVLVLGLAEHIRNLMVAKEQSTIHLLEVSDAIKDRYVEQAYLCSKSFLLSALDALNQCDIQYKMAVNKRLHVEIALLKLSQIQSLIKLSDSDLLGQKKNDSVASSPPPISKQEKKDPVSPKVQDGADNTKPEEPYKRPEVTNVSRRKGSLLVGPSLQKKDDLAKVVIDEVQRESQRQSLLNDETLQELWNEYAEITQSPSLRNIMLQARLETTGSTVKVYVGTGLGRNMLLQETAIADQIREKLFVKDLILEVYLDEKLAPEEEAPARPKNEKEKFEFLLRKNPLLGTLVKELNLKPEE